MGANIKAIADKMYLDNKETSSWTKGENETGEFSESKNMLNDLDQTKKKYTSKRKHSFFSKGDSEEYQNVRNCAEKLSNLLNTDFRALEDSNDNNHNLIYAVMNTSGDLVTFCEKYKKKSENARTTSGKMRRKKVEELQEFAEEIHNVAASTSEAYFGASYDIGPKNENKICWNKIIQVYRRAKAELESPSN